MKLKPSLITLTFFLFLFASNVKAQTPAPGFSESHLKAAERMLIASGLQDNFHKLFSSIIETQSKQLPENKRMPFTKVMNKFLDKYVSWDILKAAFEPIYANEFTEDELNQIATFLSSPAGKKMTAAQADLYKKGGEWGQNIFREHNQELEEMMKAEFQSTESPAKQ
jgi:hypothetical protein